ncbi:MAG: exodeoxyribonuclease III [Buchananella hordeovulneris]|nr:exodeoxyribonuclease III [Buchananella hordeovulneris]
MRIATWNVNSIRTRLDRVLAALARHDLDVLAMQEIKCKDTQFPTAAFEEAGYEVATWGENQWNGVAIASRVGMTGVERGFAGQPGFAKTGEPVLEPRALKATCGGIDIWSLYVPNGRELDDPHYAYKLEWLARFADVAAGAARNGDSFVAMGDFNVAPRDCDVWSPAFFEGKTHTSPAERAAFAALSEAGLSEVTMPRASGYTYWDYQQLRFPKNEGMRIDFALATEPVAQRVSRVLLDREERKGKGASDHIPVVIDLAD